MNSRLVLPTVTGFGQTPRNDEKNCDIEWSHIPSQTALVKMTFLLPFGGIYYFRGGIAFGKLRTKNWSLQRHFVFWHMTTWFRDLETSLVMTLAEVSATKWQVCNKYEALISLRFITVLKSTWHSPYIIVFMDSLVTYLLVSALYQDKGMRITGAFTWIHQHF